MVLHSLVRRGWLTFGLFATVATSGCFGGAKPAEPVLPEPTDAALDSDDAGYATLSDDGTPTTAQAAAEEAPAASDADLAAAAVKDTEEAAAAASAPSIASEALSDTGSGVADNQQDDVPSAPEAKTFAQDLASAQLQPTPAPAAVSLPPPAAPLPTQPAAPEAKAAAGPSLWVFADDVVVRSAPSNTAAKVGTLNYGAQVQIVGRPSHGFVSIGPGRFVARRFLTDRKAHFTRHPSSLPAH